MGIRMHMYSCLGDEDGRKGRRKKVKETIGKVDRSAQEKEPKKITLGI